jgi:hypothetical protein
MTDGKIAPMRLLNGRGGGARQDWWRSELYLSMTAGKGRFIGVTKSPAS